MKRSEARELLMQMFFEMELQQDFSEKRKQQFIENNDIKNSQLPYFNQGYDIVSTKKTEIDKIINKFGKKWTVETMANVDVAILRLSVAEIIYMPEIPDSASINEAVELGKKFGGDNSGKFINGILGSLVKEKNG